MPIEGQGWELHIRRLGLQSRGAKKRSYGEYQVYQDGQPVAGLSGAICEPVGPGDLVENSGKRIKKGRYPLWTQFGKYRTIGYSNDDKTVGKIPMPGILLSGTSPRTAVLIHPAHPPDLFLSSVGCLNPTNPIGAAEIMNFWDSRARVIALIESLRVFFPDAFAHEASAHIKNAFVVIDGEPSREIKTPTPAARAAPRALAAAADVANSLPVSKVGALKACRWLIDNFGPKLTAAVRDKRYQVKHLCAIVCQETAYKWLKWIDDQDAATILARCVFDASGDYPGTSRSAFPKNTAAFRRRYGDEFTDMLIEEANVTRRMQGYDDKDWVYKGYGIFQYDLQHVGVAEAFFREKLWRSFDECLTRCCSELDEKLQATRDLWRAIKAYNGSGAAAEQYAANVRIFAEYCAEVTGEP